MTPANTSTHKHTRTRPAQPVPSLPPLLSALPAALVLSLLLYRERHATMAQIARGGSGTVGRREGMLELLHDCVCVCVRGWRSGELPPPSTPPRHHHTHTHISFSSARPSSPPLLFGVSFASCCVPLAPTPAHAHEPCNTCNHNKRKKGSMLGWGVWCCTRFWRAAATTPKPTARGVCARKATHATSRRRIATR